MPLCKDCQHYVRHPTLGAGYDTCNAMPASSVIQLIRGEASRGMFCETMRSDSHECGPPGKLFEPAHARQPEAAAAGTEVGQ